MLTSAAECVTGGGCQNAGQAGEGSREAEASFPWKSLRPVDGGPASCCGLRMQPLGASLALPLGAFRPQGCRDALGTRFSVGQSRRLWGLRGKESTCQCRRYGFDPGAGKNPHAAEQPSPCPTGLESVALRPGTATREAAAMRTHTATREKPVQQ